MITSRCDSPKSSGTRGTSIPSTSPRPTIASFYNAFPLLYSLPLLCLTLRREPPRTIGRIYLPCAGLVSLLFGKKSTTVCFWKTLYFSSFTWNPGVHGLENWLLWKKESDKWNHFAKALLMIYVVALWVVTGILGNMAPERGKLFLGNFFFKLCYVETHLLSFICSFSKY